MATYEDQLQLIVDVRDAIGRLLDESEHDAWSTLRLVYGTMRNALERADTAGARADADTAKQEPRRDDERVVAPHDVWRNLDRDVKRGRVLTVLGSEGLVRREIAQRLPERLPDIDINRGGDELVPLLNEMLAAGELERAKEPRTPNCTITNDSGFRWRWRRSTAPLSSELQQLERSLEEA